MLRERATAHDISVAVTCDEDLVVSSDQLRVKQVLINLLTNAVKFTPDGGSIEVRARRRQGRVEVTVTDSGIGIPQEDRERIFESFQQGGRGTAREEGTGLGLTLSRRLVELLGGRLWLRSEVGLGSTCGFSLPAPARVEGDPRSPRDHEAVRDIVVIEDDRRSAELLSAYLSGLDLHVVSTGDGQSGLEAVRRTRPVAVLLDIRLPGVDGWAVLRTLKSDADTADIPVVVVSIVDERSRGVAMGAAAYLVKPVSRHDVLEALRTAGVEVGPDAQRGTEVEQR
jgi:CheY-like chemotaxis protein